MIIPQLGETLTLACAAPGEPYVLAGPGGALARLLPSSDTAQDVEVDGGAAWRMQAYDEGWKLALTDLGNGEPVAWYTGHTIRAGGEIVVAPDRAYDVTSRRLKALDWKVHDGDEVLDVVGSPKKKRTLVITLDVRGLPEHEADLPTLAIVIATVAYLAWVTTPRQGYLSDGG